MKQNTVQKSILEWAKLNIELIKLQTMYKTIGK